MTASKSPSASGGSLKRLRFGLIGLGGIARTVLDLMRREAVADIECTGVLVRPGRGEAARATLAPAPPVVESIDALLRLDCALVADCAGHGALRAYGRRVLDSGRDLLTVSSGAFADPQLEASLREAADREGGRILIPAGALAGIDALAAARHGGLTRVAYTGRKPIAAWRGTMAERAADLSSLREAVTFFEGHARHAARLYPMNANVAATIALAGLGFERTEVRLIADPASSANVHEVAFEGAFGRARIEISGAPSPGNPRTSLLTGLSVWQALLDRAGCAILVAPQPMPAESAAAADS
jgi:aspartate dehydrogenase